MSYLQKHIHFKLSDHPTIYLIIVYIMILVAQPHNRFDILETIRFERLLMVSCWLVLFATNKAKFASSSVIWLFLCLYCWMLLCYLMSPYGDYENVQHWFENYWKFIVLLLLIFSSVNNESDIKTLFAGIVLVMGIYQLLSWRDFAGGGSYVYQQGIKRIVGIWTGGVGSANAFGMLGMFSLPFAKFCYYEAKTKSARNLVILYFFMSLCSILFSGTRGAIIGIFVFIMIHLYTVKLKKAFISLIIVFMCGIIGISFLPDYLRYRLGLSTASKYEIDERVEEIQSESAKSRIDGLVDGWRLMGKRPVFGYGPESSSIARSEVRTLIYIEDGSYLQLHNLYGQIMGETGIVGFLLFFAVIYTIHSGFKRIRIMGTGEPSIEHTLRDAFILLLYYGMVAHTLYRYYWILLTALSASYIEYFKTLKRKN